jgi:hypothetical protein
VGHDPDVADLLQGRRGLCRLGRHRYHL